MPAWGQVWWLSGALRIPRVLLLWRYFEAMALKPEVNAKMFQARPCHSHVPYMPCAMQSLVIVLPMRLWDRAVSSPCPWRNNGVCVWAF